MRNGKKSFRTIQQGMDSPAHAGFVSVPWFDHMHLLRNSLLQSLSLSVWLSMFLSLPLSSYTSFNLIFFFTHFILLLPKMLNEDHHKANQNKRIRSVAIRRDRELVLSPPA